MHDTIIIAENIQKYRKSMGMRQEDLARLTGLSRSYICDVENGRYTPSISSMLKFSMALNVPLSELITEKQIV